MQALANKHDASMEDLKTWYDGYKIGREKSIYNPYSVMKALQRGSCRSYFIIVSATDQGSGHRRYNLDRNGTHIHCPKERQEPC